MMKMFLAVIAVVSLTACGTLGGAMQGASEDLSKAGGWIRNK